jgi:orotate phosphoribosyltransferase-like protein
MTMQKISDGSLLELYCEGLTNKEIADRLQVTQPAVHYRLEKLGLKNNYHENQCVNTAHVKMLHTKGLTNVGIALLLKTNVVTILLVTKELGLTDNYGALQEIISVTG